jgi:phosphoserine phosphatase
MAKKRYAGAALWLLLWHGITTFAQDPLPSWNDGPAKQAIVDFVQKTTTAGSAQFVPPGERIATFDEDGTLWVEHPMYTEVMFSFDRLGGLAKAHPEWKEAMPFKAVLTRDREAMEKLTLDDIMKIVVVTHTGVSPEDFNRAAADWIAGAKDPRWHRPYTELIYQPMVEVMKYLRANGYLTYIVTGGTQPFVRAFAQKTYGIPPEQVIGTTVTTSFDPAKKANDLTLDAKMLLNNNYAGKAEDIYLFTGFRPQIAFGNTSGDEEMLEYATAGNGARLGLLVLHDDKDREYAYGPATGLPDTKVGTFSQALYDAAKKQGWTVISMNKDWKRIFAFDANPSAN